MKRPIPLFDTLENIGNYSLIFSEDNWMKQDYLRVIAFLKFYQSDIATLHACHRELERLLLWSWYIAKKSLQHLGKADIESFINFCEKPPTNWIGTKKVARFITENRQQFPNPEWRPFIAIIKKKSFRRRRRSNVKDFELSPESK